jgi:hypothetical protein
MKPRSECARPSGPSCDAESNAPSFAAQRPFDASPLDELGAPFLVVAAAPGPLFVQKALQSHQNPTHMHVVPAGWRSFEGEVAMASLGARTAKALLKLASLREQEATVLRELSDLARGSDALAALLPVAASAEEPKASESKDSIQFNELDVERARRHARRLGFPIRRKP